MQNQPNQESAQTPRERSAPTGEFGVAQRAERAAMQVKSAAVERVGAARQDAASELGRGRSAIVSRVRGVGTALRSAGDKLRDDDDVVAGYAEKASERIESIANYIDSAQPRELVRDAEDLARTHPAWFFGGAFLLGLAAGRFIKASAGSSEFAGASSGGPAPRIPRSGMVPRKASTAPPPPPRQSPGAMSSSSVDVARTVDVPGSMNPTSALNPLGRP